MSAGVSTLCTARAEGVATDPAAMTGAEAAAQIARGALSVEELARAALARTDRLEPMVRAFSWLDRDQILRRAREADKPRARTGPRGGLHGLMLAVKDMIDTADMPTQHNSPLYIDHRPGQDAAVVAICRAEEALIVGKADTHEFASGGRLAASRNPHDLAHTPGGSSSGSGAAIAAGFAHLALGTQTGGSVLRPASFCGIFGMKPTWGTVSQEGAKLYAVSLDTMGWYGRSVGDLALMAQATRAVRRPVKPRKTLRGTRIGLCRTPWWETGSDAMKAATERAAVLLREAGATVVDFDLPEGFEQLNDMQNKVMRGEGRAAFLADYLRHGTRLHQDFRDRVEDADAIGWEGLRRAQDFCAACRPRFDAAMQGWDALLVPGALGAAPRDLTTTGDPMFQRAWTALHVPCIGLPGFADANGMPLGVQLIGPRHADAELLELAAAAARALGAAAVNPVDPTEPRP
ncbi:MAG: amidase [Pararhodobacter sp.]